ncbi:hypothetical protein ASD65_10245 [Microbacterium sp. Root61]|uniref:serine hydrolase domain-containing protein n=1 Tax=Microbacterium sp. Root61 TaxID=1736570 RepID=UPI0006FE7AD8|nr:serine hydrolase domain-containing protein [Microbacterium sp. Root61]KRA24758.1 hypothetical protein ASD65_10245 [Microbacterium sp. Root61]
MTQTQLSTGARIDLARVQAYLDDAAARFGVPGAAMAVSIGDEQVIAVTGITSTRDPLPIQPDTTFMIASVSKTFTATVAAILAERGILDFDRPVADYLPSVLEVPEHLREQRAKVRVRDLFTHTAGWLGDVEVLTGEGDDALARAVDEVLPTVPQHLEPGTQTSYNNMALIVAGRVIEVVTGDSFENVLRDLVLEPLGLDHTFLSPGEVANRRHGVGHYEVDGRLQPEEEWSMPRGHLPAGGISSSIADQLAYARAHLRFLREGGQLSSAAAQEMMTPQARLGPDQSVGTSWMLTQRPGGPLIVGHGGNANLGTMTELYIVPELDLAVVVVATSWGGFALVNEACDWVLDELVGAPLSVPAVDPASDRWDDYVGTYVCGGWTFRVRRAEDVLIIGIEMEGATDLPDLDATVVLRGDGIVSASRPRGAVGEFVRDGDGRVVGLRSSHRYAHRTAAQ